MRVLRLEDRREWDETLARIGSHDFYHTHAWHRIAEERREGTARLFVHSEGETVIALPLLLRSLDGVPGGCRAWRRWWDATSVYGYAGPLCSNPEPPQEALVRFRRGLERIARRMKIVSVFSRLHPFMNQEHLVAGLGEVRLRGRTVSVDVTAPEDVQVAAFRGDHRRDIRRLRRMGLECLVDTEWNYLPEFERIYSETMCRVRARDLYFFDRRYFEALRRDLNAHLFVVLGQGEALSGGVMIESGGILHYHLGGTATEHVSTAAGKLVMDEARRWAKARGLRTLHLGGGVGGREDSLFYFKTGFSDRTHPFRLWRWIVNPATYGILCERWANGNRRAGVDHSSSDYFPPYRCPVEPQRG